MGRRPSRGVWFLALCLLLGNAACASEGSDSRQTGDAAPPTAAIDSPATTTGPAGERKAAARWETVTTFTGNGPTETPEFTVVADAIQWRVRWNCESGTLRITSTPPPRRPAPLVDSPCPKAGDGFAIHTGAIRLGVEATGPWKAIVDQQVDRPLDEPPPAGMASAAVIADGPFRDVEKMGTGSARLYRLTDGRRLLRFENFETSANTDLFVWLSEASDPKTSVDAIKADKVVLGNLKSTIGTQNYEIPANVPTDAIRSVVIWCEPVAIAYAAANLSR